MTGPRGKRTPGGGLVKRSLEVNTAEADLIRTVLRIEFDTLDGLINGPDTPTRDRYHAETQRRQLGALIGRLDPLTYEDKDEGSPPSEY